MIDPDHMRLSIVRKCFLVFGSRSVLNCHGRGESVFNLKLTRLIGEKCLKAPLRAAAVRQSICGNRATIIDEKGCGA